jgi:GTPase-associated protein 1
MSFQQLYYTSCEHGLAGYGGFQFNAVTPGTAGETMRTVESLVRYDVPRSLESSIQPDELRRCPVNLCHAPGPVTVLASVCYAGQDSSQRPGNFFAHALAAPDFAAQLGGTLPIELWRGPFWASQQAPSTELPSLSEPLETGTLSREVVSRFLDGHPGRGQLSLLISAAAAAQAAAGQQVLVVGETSDEVAQWFAAACYLLPPSLARKLSFATYLSRPSQSRLQLLGTVPETDLDLGPEAVHDFRLFDFPAGRFSPVTELPLARLTASIGVLAAPALWQWADTLARGDEASAAAWYPVVAAAAALGLAQLSEGDLAAAVSWLDGAGHLPAGTQSQLGWALHGHPELTAEQGRILRRVGERCGDEPLVEQTETELLEAGMQAALESSSDPPAPDPASRPAVRDQITGRCQEVLQECTAPVPALRLLGWAARAGLPVDERAVRASVTRVIAPALLRPGGPEDREVAERARQAASQWDAFREGLAASLDRLSSQHPGQLGAGLAGLAGELISEADLGPYPHLAEPYLVSVARRAHERDRIEVLCRIADLRAGQPLDEALLEQVWNRGYWTRSEARQALRSLSPAQLVTPAVLSWLDQTVDRDLRPEKIEVHVCLCEELLGSPAGEWLPLSRADQLRSMVEMNRVAHQANHLKDLERLLPTEKSRYSQAGRLILARRLLPALARVHGNPARLESALRELPLAAFRDYATAAERAFSPPVRAAPDHAAALWLLTTARHVSPQRRDLALNLLSQAAERWPGRLIETAAGLIGKVDRAEAERFLSSVQSARPGTARRAFRQAAGVLRAIGAARPPGQDHDHPRSPGQED